MRLRRATNADHERAGEVTVAAYADLTRGSGDPYVERLRDTAARDREAELWVATPADGDDVLGGVTICPEGSSWRELDWAPVPGVSLIAFTVDLQEAP